MKKSLLNRLSEQEILWCTQYAFNSLFRGGRFAQHLVALAEGIAKDLHDFSEEKAKHILKKKRAANGR